MKARVSVHGVNSATGKGYLAWKVPEFIFHQQDSMDVPRPRGSCPYLHCSEYKCTFFRIFPLPLPVGYVCHPSSPSISAVSDLTQEDTHMPGNCLPDDVVYSLMRCAACSDIFFFVQRLTGCAYPSHILPLLFIYIFNPMTSFPYPHPAALASIHAIWTKCPWLPSTPPMPTPPLLALLLLAGDLVNFNDNKAWDLAGCMAEWKKQAGQGFQPIIHCLNILSLLHWMYCPRIPIVLSAGPFLRVSMDCGEREGPAVFGLPDHMDQLHTGSTRTGRVFKQPQFVLSLFLHSSLQNMGCGSFVQMLPIM
ncbi:hypothetical protein SRHO_G00018400 [Serrasalmus rhombeus]